MPLPSPEARTLLDESAQNLALIGLEKNLPLKLEDFDPEKVVQAERAERSIRNSLFRWTILLLSVILMVLFWGVFIVAFSDTAVTTLGGAPQTAIPSINPSYVLIFASLWFFALGGLGAVTNLFSVYLQLRPPEALRETDTFVVNARIILGCIGSFVVSLTVLAPYASQFFNDVLSFRNPTGGWRLLIPFIVGFAIPLALALLQRLIRTLEFFLGIDISAARSEPSGTRQRR